VLPSGLGTMEISAFIIFDFLGIPNEISFAVLLMIRFATFVIPLIMMLSIMPFIDFDIFKMRLKLKKGKV
jgi:uncharacterized membrane protein YbhN (UPF0104 family)